MSGARAGKAAVEARPFIKWAGGKTQLLEAFDALFPEVDPETTYHEPFVGSGAVYFHLHATGRLPDRAVLSDLNEHLVACWQAVRNAPRRLAARLTELKASHSREEYYRVRARYNEEELDPVERAALLVYLNKTGFNGLYRVNRSGRFNVPCGRQQGGPFLPSQEHLIACAEALSRAEIAHSPFDAVLERARRGDFVYLDPPYVPLDAGSSFTRYAKAGFGEEDQERLRDVFAALDRRGCRLVLSNSDTALVHELYRGFRIDRVPARRNINRKPSGRGAIAEVVVRNFSGARTA
jgi:DNA adenine methylase